MCYLFWYHIGTTPEISLHSGIHVSVLLFAGGQKWWSSFPPPSAWTDGPRERLSFPVKGVRHVALPASTSSTSGYNNNRNTKLVRLDLGLVEELRLKPET